MVHEPEIIKTREEMGGDGAVLAEQLQRAHQTAETARSVILVEGVSDQRAVEALARRRRRDLEKEGVVVIPIAGATNIGRFLDLLRPGDYDLRLAGLCDEGEELQFRMAFERAALGSRLDRHGLAQLGFFVCLRDLEEELIRALGVDAMLSLIESQRQLRRFRSFQNQPAQSHKSIEEQIWRWLGNHKVRYASLMVEALSPDRVPAPLDGVLTRV